jgi:hypothetical protein
MHGSRMTADNRTGPFLPDDSDMREAHTAPDLTLDLVEELRLRRWARVNHVPGAERNPDWHPVILDEMDRKDDEVAEQRPMRARERYVPLAPIRTGAPLSHELPPPCFLASPALCVEPYYT